MVKYLKELSTDTKEAIVMPQPFEEWWRGIKCYPCLCVRLSVRPKFVVRSITFERLTVNVPFAV